jgi:hypothetical protein
MDYIQQNIALDKISDLVCSLSKRLKKTIHFHIRAGSKELSVDITSKWQWYRLVETASKAGSPIFTKGESDEPTI